MSELKKIATRDGFGEEILKLGLENPVVHNTDMAIQVAAEAIRKLIREDQAK